MPDLPHTPLDAIDLADAVEAVRHGLVTGAARGAGQAVRFEVGEIHMEFAVTLERVRTGHGGIKAVVVEAGADTARTTGRTHTVSFTLRPKDAATGRPVEIAAPDEGTLPGDAPRPPR
ncbi:trypco2 family protein [Streptomyces sp. NPDC008079]|uniref:trypco2 family protein n=1 Tax=unclassified Streptomyces TaxID=2593676 RepID=UPI0036EF4C5D